VSLSDVCGNTNRIKKIWNYGSLFRATACENQSLGCAGRSDPMGWDLRLVPEACRGKQHRTPGFISPRVVIGSLWWSNICVTWMTGKLWNISLKTCTCSTFWGIQVLHQSILFDISLFVEFCLSVSGQVDDLIWIWAFQQALNRRKNILIHKQPFRAVVGLLFYW